MPSLKEIKGRISSVKSTLKITSAMKLVSSAKLRKAQKAIEAMRPYEAQLLGILLRLEQTLRAKREASKKAPVAASGSASPGEGKVVIVAIASNSSLCGAFNANVVRKVRELLSEYPDAEVYSIGRKLADALRKAGYPSPENLNVLAEHPDYAASRAFSARLREEFATDRIARVLLVYNHFISTSRQDTGVETFLPAELPSAVDSGKEEMPLDYILEPDAASLVDELYPKVQDLRFYTALLDSAAAEHATRTVAMQIATDNGEDLLHELTLQYNKSRQQKITSEILDLAGGAAGVSNNA